MQSQKCTLGIIMGLTIASIVCISSVAFAFSITVINDTEVPLRIDLLEDNCGTVYVAEGNPNTLAPGQLIKFHNVMPIVHHYKMCANGTCESTSLGMTLGVEEYFMVVTLKDQSICVKQKPLIWPGTFKCKEAQYEI